MYFTLSQANLSSDEPLPLLDEEFDKVETAPAPAEPQCASHASPVDDLAWEDQLDDGVEITLTQL